MDSYLGEFGIDSSLLFDGQEKNGAFAKEKNCR